MRQALLYCYNVIGNKNVDLDFKFPGNHVVAPGCHLMRGNLYGLDVGGQSSWQLRVCTW